MLYMNSTRRIFEKEIEQVDIYDETISCSATDLLAQIDKNLQMLSTSKNIFLSL